MPVHLSSITIKNLLSFGPEGVTLELQPLNVLIGPNGCGKSNILSVISLIQAAKRDIHEEMNKGGGAMSWFHRPIVGGEAAPRAAVATTWHLTEPDSVAHRFRHVLDLTAAGGTVALGDESLQHHSSMAGLAGFAVRKGDRFPSSYLNMNELGGFNGLTLHPAASPIRVSHVMYRDLADLLPDSEAAKVIEKDFGSRRDVPEFPSDPARCEPNQSLLTSVNTRSYIANCALFGDFDTSRTSPIRSMGHTSDRQDFLLPDGKNLALVLRNLEGKPKVRRRLLEELKTYCDRFDHFTQITHDTFVELILHEGDRPVPASRLSDGTLRYLCLLAILLHPSPPPLVMIEEPELGLHPDIIPQLGKLLIEASERTQLIITTHSDFLVDCFHGVPESVVVCEQENGETTFNRLDATELAPWLEKYRLGTLWTRGDIGGNRW